jgi:hypothetical protein
MECTKRYFVDRKEIGFFKQVLESYEELAIFSVLDGKAGLIELIYPLSSEVHLGKIIEDMGRYGITFREEEHV